MTVSSRTPEGFPDQCLFCGRYVDLEFSNPGDNATCPHCGTLIFQSAETMERLQTLLEQKWNVKLNEFDSSVNLQDLTAGSIESVELVMSLEEEFDISIPTEELERLQTLRDVIQFILNRKKGF